jgi:hypothetical protein
MTSKKLLSLFIISCTIVPLAVNAGNPVTPISPNDNIQDPGAATTLWGGCGPLDSNCYITVGSTHDPVTINAINNGLSINGSQELSLGLASAGATGALSSADWTVFNNKLGTALGNGLLWIGNGLNTATPVAISGHATLSNAGVLTLASVGTAGTYGSATQVPVLTTDAQGRVTGVVNTTITPAATSITGAQNVTAGSTKITLGGTPTGATLQPFSIDINEGNLVLNNIGGTLSATKGGTGLTTYTTGDIIYASAANTLSSLAAGTNGHVLTLAGGIPTWSAPSTGITSLGGQTGATQTFATGTAGTDFGISSAGNVHTFNIPDASAVNRGLVTTGAQTFAGAKTFTGNIDQTGATTWSTGTGAISLNGPVSVTGTNTFTVGTGLSTLQGSLSVEGNTTLGNATTDRLTLTAQILGGTPFVLQGATDNAFSTTLAVTDPTANNTITFPDASGTVLLGTAQNVTAGSTKITLGGTPTGAALQPFSIDINEGNLTLNNIGGTLSATKGGTGLTTYTTGDIIYASAANTLSSLAAGTNGHVLTLAGGIPTWSAPSTGITSLGGQTGATQTFATGTAGTDFGISSAGDVHTFNIPDASAVNRGLVTTGAQTFAGVKTFTGNIDQTGATTWSTGTGAISLNGPVSVTGTNTFTVGTGLSTLQGTLSVEGNTTLGNATTDRLTVTAQILGVNPFVLQGATDNAFSTTLAVTDPTANNTITFPDASGTVLLGTAQNVTAGSTKITLGGTPTGAALQPFSIDINEGNLSLNNIGGTLSATKGGTGLTTYTTGDIIYASAANTLSSLAAGTNGHVLTLAGGIPTWSAPSTGITSLGGQTGATQTFATGTAGTDFGISSAGDVHTFNIPTSSATNRGLLSSADWTNFDDKIQTADNGLTLTGSSTTKKVQLGGDLVQNTTLTNNGFPLIFTGSTLSSRFTSDGRLGINTTTPSTGYAATFGAGGATNLSGVYINGAASGNGLRLNGSSFIALGSTAAGTGTSTAYLRQEGSTFTIKEQGFDTRLSVNLSSTFTAPHRSFNAFTVVHTSNPVGSIVNGAIGIAQSTGGSATQRGLRIMELTVKNYYSQYVTAGGDLAFHSGTQNGSNNDVGDTERVRFQADGDVGIGNTNPGFLLHVGDSAVVSGTSVARFENAGGTCTVTPNVAGGITCTSDKTLKKNIEDLDVDDLINKLNQVDIKLYNMLVDQEGAPKQIGFIAQNLETLFPSLVVTDAFGKKSVSYSAMTPVLTRALQEVVSQLSEPIPSGGEIDESSLFYKFTTKLDDWLATGNQYLTKIFVREIHTDTLCVGDTCITEDQLKTLLDGQSSGNSSNEGHSNNSGSNTQENNQNVEESTNTENQTTGEMPESVSEVIEPSDTPNIVEQSVETTSVEELLN